MTEARKLKRRLVFLHILSFVASVAPVAIAVIMNADEWFSTPREAVKIGIGVIIGAVLIIMKVLGKIKMPRRLVTFGLVFAMVYLLSSILPDMLLLSGMAFLGEALDLLCFQRAIHSTREKIGIKKTADATAKQIEDILDKYVGSGRT